MGMAPSPGSGTARCRHTRNKEKREEKRRGKKKAVSPCHIAAHPPHHGTGGAHTHTNTQGDAKRLGEPACERVHEVAAVEVEKEIQSRSRRLPAPPYASARPQPADSGRRDGRRKGRQPQCHTAREA